MNKICMFFAAVCVAFLGISYSHAETNTNRDAMPSLSKEIKNALPDIFGNQGFASAQQGGSAGFVAAPNGVDVGVAIETNRDITFAGLQTGQGNIVPPVGPGVIKPPISARGTLGERWLSMLNRGVISQETYYRLIHKFLLLPDELRWRIKAAYDHGNTGRLIEVMHWILNYTPPDPSDTAPVNSEGAAPFTPPSAHDTLGQRWLGMLSQDTITQVQYDKGVNNFLLLPDEKRWDIKNAYDNGHADKIYNQAVNAVHQSLNSAVVSPSGIAPVDLSGIGLIPPVNSAGIAPVNPASIAPSANSAGVAK